VGPTLTFPRVRPLGPTWVFPRTVCVGPTPGQRKWAPPVRYWRYYLNGSVHLFHGYTPGNTPSFFWYQNDLIRQSSRYQPSTLQSQIPILNDNTSYK
jgi:hypothetical protein